MSHGDFEGCETGVDWDTSGEGLGEVRIIGLKLNAFVAHLDEIQRFCGTFG
jgi:hypothetical protein